MPLAVSHAVHWLEPMAANSWGAHGVHSAAFDVVEAVPAGQSVQ